MPAVSRKQFRFMKAVQGGYIHPKDLSPEKAKEYTSENKSLKNLPESAPKDSGHFKKLRSKLR